MNAEKASVNQKQDGDVPMVGDGFVNPESPKAAKQELTVAEKKVEMWKKMLHQGVCMDEILNELENERPPLSMEQIQTVFTLLLDRIYNLKDAPVQEKVVNFFAGELVRILTRDELTSEDLDLVCFILTENHSIFNHRVSANTAQVAQRLSTHRYPDSTELQARDLAFLQSITDQVASAPANANFSHFYAHLALTLQTKPGCFERLVSEAARQGLFKMLQMITLLTKLKRFVREDSWQGLAQALSDACLQVCLQDSPEVRNQSKKELLDFTDSLERILLHGYKKLYEGIAMQRKLPDTATEAERAEHEALVQATELKKREFVYRVSELIQLDFAVRCLQMPVLEKKLAGATMLVMKVVTISKPNSGTKGAGSKPHNYGTEKQQKWLTEATLLDWMREKQIFSVFFGTSLHPEVIKKSFYVLDFLYRHGELTERELNKMWLIATKKHEAFKVSIMRALIFMASRLEPKELQFLFGKLQSMQFREHDKFSLLLLKSIAKALAPTQKQAKTTNAGNSGGGLGGGGGSGLNKGMLDEFDRSKRQRGRAGSFDGKPSGSLAGPADTMNNKGLLLDEFPKQKPRRDSNDSLKVNKRRQRSFSPDAVGKRNLQRRGGINLDFQMPMTNDEDDAALQAAIAMSMVQADAPPQAQQETFSGQINMVSQDQAAAPRSGGGGGAGSTGFEPRAEDLFDVPLDKQSKKTADGDMSPQMTDEEEFKANENASKALDLPISTSHSPQTAENAPNNANEKPSMFNEEAKMEGGEAGSTEHVKAEIGDYFYLGAKLGLENTPEELSRRALAVQVLAFMWQLCLDDSVFGGQAPSDLPFESESQRGQNNLNRIEASLRPKKGLSIQNHALCIDQFAEVINYNYPADWFSYIHECVNRLKANMQSMTMQAILKKLLLGTQFPMLDIPSKPESISQLQGDINDEAYVLGLSQDQQSTVAIYLEQVRRIKVLPKTRVDLLNTLEEEIGLTAACLSSYINFKSEALQLIYAYNYGNVHEEEYLETQSSLDGDDDKLMTNTSVTSADPVVGQQSAAASLSVPRSQLQNQMDVDITSEGQEFATQIDPTRINDRLQHQVMQVANRLHSRSDAFSLEEDKEEFKHPSSARLPAHSGFNNNGNGGAAGAQQRDSRSFLDTMVTNRVYNYSYAKEMSERLDFLRFLVAQSPESMLKPRQIQILWECLVSNAYYEKERDLFFVWCTEILTAARRKQSARQSNGIFEEENDFFSDDCLELLFFDTLLKLDFRFFTEGIYNCFENFFIHVNEQYGQIVTTFQTQLEIFDFKLIGIEALIEIVLQVRDAKVHEKASTFLMKIYKSLNKELMESKIAEIKMDLLSVCMGNVRKGQQELNESCLTRPEADYSLQAVTDSDHQNRVARSIQILSKFIEHFEGFKDNSQKGKSLRELADPEVKVIIQNQVSKTQGPLKFEVNWRANSTTVQMMMNHCAENITPRRDVNELTLTYKGKDLKENLKTLKQAMGSQYGKSDSVIMILSSKSAIEMEYMDQDLAVFGTKIGGQSGGGAAGGESHNFDPVLLKEKVDELKMFLEGSPASDEIIELAVKKCNLKIDEAIMMVVTDDGIADLQAELTKEIEERQENNLMVIAGNQPAQQTSNFEEEFAEEQIPEDKLNLIVSNKAEYFDLLFELLNLGVPDITQAVWKLMMQVPINQKLLNRMKSLEAIALEKAAFVDDEDQQLIKAPSNIGWQSIIDPNSPYKMLYSLQILNTLVSVNNQVLSDVEVQERHEWRQRFLDLGGFNHLYTILVTSDINEMVSVPNPNQQTSDSADPNKKLSHQQQQRHGKKTRSKLLKTSSIQAAMPAAKKGIGSQIDQVRCLSFLISITKIFLHAALLTVDYENLLSLVVQSSTSPFRNDRKRGQGNDDQAKGSQLEQLVTQGLSASEKQNRSYGREASDSGSRAGNTSGTGTPKFGSEIDAGGKSQTAEEKSNREQAQNTSFSSINARPKNTYTQVDDFPRLVEQIKQSGVAQMLLDQVIDFQELMRKLLQIIYSAVIYQENRRTTPEKQAASTSTTGVTKTTSSSSDMNVNEALSELLQHSLDLILPCLIWQPDLLLKEIYEFEHLEKLLVRALTQIEDETGRKAVERTFRIVCTHKMQGASRNQNGQSQHEASAMTDPARQNREMTGSSQGDSESTTQLAAHVSQPKEFILKILLKSLPSAQTKLTHCEEYFNLIASIIRACGDLFVIEPVAKNAMIEKPSVAAAATESNKVIDLSQVALGKGQLSATYLLRVFVDQIKSRPINETKTSSEAQPDRILAGYLQITQALLEVSPVELKAQAGSQESGDHDLVNTLFKYLFELPNSTQKAMKDNQPVQTVSELLKATFNPPSSSQQQSQDLPKCKSKLSRKRTFNLLHNLCQNQPNNYSMLLANLFVFHKEIQEAAKVANQEQIEDFLEGLVNPNSSMHAMRSASGYVGLRNFGCTCYMNSLIQQLFMLPDFRKGILSAPLPKEIRPEETTVLVLRELQQTFANLQETVKEFYAPSSFIRAFQFHGEPINVREQQDTHEFYNVLCDYLENISPEVTKMLRSSVGGVLCNEIKSLEKEYAYVGESEELFTALSLDIKNKRRVQDALDLYVRPDILDGDNKYFCEKFQKHVDAQKRTYLKSLSDTVVINLKRFEYDFQTFQRNKINDYCEFPEVIDLRPWTKQGIEEQESAAAAKKRRSTRQRKNSQGNHAARKDSAMMEDEEFEESPDLNEDDEMCDEDMLSDQVSNGDVADEDGEGSLLDECGRFSENDAIESSENSRPNNTEEGDGDFEDLIAQEEDQAMRNKSGFDKSNQKSQPAQKRRAKSAKGLNQGGTGRGGTTREAENEYLYQLVGVLVHSGSANSGHYYSYIKERSEKGRWLEFNDRIVKEFDFNNLAKECFGTPPDDKQANKTSDMRFMQWERHANAYLLFYERVHKKSEDKTAMQENENSEVTESAKEQTAATLQQAKQESEPLPLVDNQDVIMQEMTTIATTDQKKQPKKEAQTSSADPNGETQTPSLINNMSAELYKAIHTQNQAFLQLKLFYDAEYFQFIRDFVAQFKLTMMGSSGGGGKAQQEDLKHSLYFSKSDSESYTQKRLMQLTAEYLAEDPSTNGTTSDDIKARYINAYSKIVEEGEDKVLDIFQDPDWAENLRKDPSQTVLKFAVMISFDIALKVKDISGFVHWMQILEPLFARSAQSCLWFIKYITLNKKVLNALLLENPSCDVRESFSRLLKTALNVTVKNEELYLMEQCEYLRFVEAPAAPNNNALLSSSESFQQVTEYKSAAIRFCQYFCGEMLDTKVRENWRCYEEYFDILTDFTQSSFPIVRFLVENRTIYRILEFVMNKQANFSKSTFVKMGSAIGNSGQPSVRQPLDLLSYLIRCTVTSGITGQSKYAPTSVFQDEERNISIPATEIHQLFRPECFTELLNRCADSYSEDAQKALCGIVQHLSWGDRNVSQFFINQLIEFIHTKQNKMTGGASGQAGLPSELDVSFKVLRGLLTLMDEPLHLERFTFMFDLQMNYVDKKPFLEMIHQLKSRNAKFVLFALAFVAEIALTEEVGPYLVSYLYEYRTQISLWVLTFLESHATNSASPLNMACSRTIESTLASWRQILQVTEPLTAAAAAATTQQDQELNHAQVAGDHHHQRQPQQQDLEPPLIGGGDGDHAMQDQTNEFYQAQQDMLNQQQENLVYDNQGNQFDFLAMQLDDIEQPSSPHGGGGGATGGNISFDDNDSFN